MAQEPLIDPNYTPSYVFKEGHFYCDGVKVQPSQMTEEEIRRYVPRNFQSGFLRAIGITEDQNVGKK